MSSKFAEFLSQNQIDKRRLLVASYKLERLRPEDRAIKFSKQRAKASGAKPEAAEGEKAASNKPRSGRPVTERLITAALGGKTVPGPAKTRLLRAVNHVLEQKKKAAVELKTLF